MKFICTGLLVLLSCATALAWDEADWINAGKFVGRDGSLCCGPLDCVRVEEKDLTANPDGSFFIKSLAETIPSHEAQWKSPDGRYWRCHKFDGSRRCFFAPPPNT